MQAGRSDTPANRPGDRQTVRMRSARPGAGLAELYIEATRIMTMPIVAIAKAKVRTTGIPAAYNGT